MEIYTYERPSACRSASLRSAVGCPACLPAWPQRCRRRPQVHQVQAQAELVLAPASRGVNGTSGFTRQGHPTRQAATDVRGVPPRGRPV